METEELGSVPNGHLKNDSEAVSKHTALDHLKDQERKEGILDRILQEDEEESRRIMDESASDEYVHTHVKDQQKKAVAGSSQKYKIQQNKDEDDDDDVDDGQDNEPGSVDVDPVPQDAAGHHSQDSDTGDTYPKGSEQENIGGVGAQDKGVVTKQIDAPDETNSGTHEQRPVSAVSTASTDSNDDGDYSMSEDQKQALKELQAEKLELGFTEEEDPPEYDVRERVRQLNQELAEEPTPDEDERARSIKFKENLVDLVAPPPDFSEEETEDEATKTDKVSDKKKENLLSDDAQKGDGQVEINGNMNTNENEDEKSIQQENEDSSTSPVQEDQPQTPRGQEKSRVRIKSAGKSRGKQEHHTSEGADWDSGDHHDEDDEWDDESINDDHNDDSVEDKKTSEGEEKVLVERDGKFELVSASELAAEEEEKRQRERSEHTPSPPLQPRPATAPSGSKSRSGNQRRSRSAQEQNSARSSGEFACNYTSVYAMSPEERQRRAREQRDKEKYEQDQKKKEQEEDERKRRENNDAFEAWLKKKRKQQDQQAKEHNSTDERENEDQQEGASFSTWMNKKREQQKSEKMLENQKQKEELKFSAKHTDKENKKAFREWLKKKKVPTATLR